MPSNMAFNPIIFRQLGGGGFAPRSARAISASARWEALARKELKKDDPLSLLTRPLAEGLAV